MSDTPQPAAERIAKIQRLFDESHTDPLWASNEWTNETVEFLLAEVTALRAANEKAVAEHDELTKRWHTIYEAESRRADAAESERDAFRAKNQRLEAALRKIAERDTVLVATGWERPPLVVALDKWNECTEIAKAALADPPSETGKDTPHE